MDNLIQYREAVQTVLQDYRDLRLSASIRKSEVEVETIFDTKRDHYQIVRVGWSNNRRTYGCVFHLDIEADKIWIQYNGIEVDVAQKLVDLGIPKHDIVLGFHAPYKRKYTGYASE